MKKHVLFSAAMVAAMSASAQTGEITSNRGENWLSQSGDWGLTFDAQPLLNYVGNLFNNGTNNMSTVWLLPNGATGSGNLATSGIVIGGKKLIDANTAYRGKLRIGFGSNKNTVLVSTADPLDDVNNTVEDIQKIGIFGVNIGAGLEKRFGSTRVVGVYGGEVNLGLSSGKTTYEYGNALSATNTSHSNSFGQGAGVTEAKNASTFGLGINGFIGVEWFAAPKLSLSGEYTWGLALSSTGFTETTTESWVPSTTTPNTGSVESNTSEGGTKRNNFGIDTGVSGLSIGVNFYFQ